MKNEKFLTVHPHTQLWALAGYTIHCSLFNGFYMKEEIIPRALKYFTQYGFKTFTMDDLSHNLGISKKTLYEHFSSKNELVEACLDYVIEGPFQGVESFVEGEGSVIENVFHNQKQVQNFFNINSARPIWELQRYFPKAYERLNSESIKCDERFLDSLLKKGWQEGLFREEINVPFFKTFYIGVQHLRNLLDTFPERDFAFWETIYTLLEYFFRIVVNEKGLKELERVLQKIKNNQ